MKHALNLLSVILLTALSITAYAQKTKTENDYNLKKAYGVLQEENDEAKALDLVNSQLRDVKIGDAVLHNVDAFVVKSQKAPLLFRQSAMERFGTITIDNQNNKLIIKH